ncbi:hypothetical protein B0H17DRAFT_206022 [Mycena rosella]|uniref:Uncharacterized protein n=1 Tax=Mycena rosella TaxID=1033263 RepID=A0AAD7D224_MYCRO|nr:hypothetical protein B0H17DRAFT_206022 [Mycena rosella]
MPPTASNSSRAGRTRNPSAAQRQTNKNRADAAAKTRANKEKAQKATARKVQRGSNNARAAALRDATNAGEAEPLSAEEQIAALTARLEAAEAKNEALNRKNKKLKKSVHPQTASTDAEIVPIPKPKRKFNLQEAMQLEDNRKLFTELQAGVHSAALEAKIDFESNWSQQDPGTVAKIFRVMRDMVLLYDLP